MRSLSLFHILQPALWQRTIPSALLLLSVVPAVAQNTETRLLRSPAVHGDTIVFSYAGDLWSAKTEPGSLARRLTTHPGRETSPRISSDGRWIAFNGMYDGPSEVYLIPSEGGEPRRLTYEGGSATTLDWTPDGKVAYMSAAASYTSRQPRLCTVEVRGGLPARTPIAEISWGSYSGDGKAITYTRAPGHFGWRRYRGGQTGRISTYEFATNTYRELLAGQDQYLFPLWVRRSIYFVSDREHATLNLYRYDLDTKRETQLTRFLDADIRSPNTDGKSIVWERDGVLERFDIASGLVTRLSPRIPGEQIPTRPTFRSLGDRITSVSLSPSGMHAAVEARGEIFSVPAKTGETRNLTRTSGAREIKPRWSPDGKTIAYLSDATGEVEVYIQPAGGGDPTRLTQEGGKITFTALGWSPDGKRMELRSSSNDLYVLDIASKRLTHVLKWRFPEVTTDWSPDSRWLALTDLGQNRMGAVYLYEIGSGRLSKVTEGYYSDNAIAFDRNGKYLYLQSTRTYATRDSRFDRLLNVDHTDRIYVLPLSADTPNPLRPPSQEEPAVGQGAAGHDGAAKSDPMVRVDLEGLAGRALPLPLPADNYTRIVGANNGVIYAAMAPGSTEMTLGRFDLGSRESQTIYKGPEGLFDFNPARTRLAVYSDDKLSIVEVKPGVDLSAGRVDTSGVAAMIDPRAEWRQIFWEAWRFERDSFYDPKMVGLDWAAIGKRYEQYLPSVSHRSDLNYLLQLMLSELGTSHAYVSGGDMGTNPTPPEMGRLGADYEADGDHVRFTKIYYGQNFEEARRGPLGESGFRVAEGEYLLAIDGEPVTARVHPNALLAGKANRYVNLTVNKQPSMEGARTVRVMPVASEATLRYAEWAEATRRYVAEKSGARIGYMHLPNILNEGITEFLRGYYSQTDKDAMIVDERWNGGGYLVQQTLVDTLMRTTHLGLQQRNAADYTGSWAIEGPKVMLTNEYAGSGGDSLPWTFRVSGAGKLIGRRTMGALVGINETLTLVDGGEVTAPGLGLYDRRTGILIAENTGIEPDIEVDMRPDLVAKGEDPQLDAAIKYLMEELKKLPPRTPRKEIPRVLPAGRVGR